MSNIKLTKKELITLGALCPNTVYKIDCNGVVAWDEAKKVFAIFSPGLTLLFVHFWSSKERLTYSGKSFGKQARFFVVETGQLILIAEGDLVRVELF